MNKKIPVHIECVVEDHCSLSSHEVRDLLLEDLKTNVSLFKGGNLEIKADLQQHLYSVCVVDLPSTCSVSFWQADLRIHVFRLCDTEPDKDFLDGEDDLPAFEQWELPNTRLTGLWDSVVTEDGIKERMLGYAETSVAFSEARVNSTIISWNRMMMLHGPPGTGKTTLCKALAQKVYIRNTEKFSSGVLLDINAHSLFSKWFSESGKLVMKLFDHIAEIAEDTETLVVVLVDEVESIASSRSASSRSNEPGDAVRVVNSVLTSLDALRRRENVLMLCTSNMVNCIDAAFLDRLDLRVYLGNPPPRGIYSILRSCIVELARTGRISASSMEEDKLLLGLVKLVAGCEGMSGRTLRKLPLRAHAYHLLSRRDRSLTSFVAAMLSTVLEKENDNEVDI
eukprot:GSChrysophyteH1.ASY1.ANO1.2483.1 assembled CDS